MKEFFANRVEKEGKRVYVRGHWVEFNREEINILFGDKTRLGYPSKVSRVVPPSGVPLYNP